MMVLIGGTATIPLPVLPPAEEAEKTYEEVKHIAMAIAEIVIPKKISIQGNKMACVLAKEAMRNSYHGENSLIQIELKPNGHLVLTTINYIGKSSLKNWHHSDEDHFGFELIENIAGKCNHRVEEVGNQIISVTYFDPDAILQCINAFPANHRAAC